MRGLIRRHRGWVVFFGSVLALLLLASSALFAVHLMDRDRSLEAAQARLQEQRSEQEVPPPVMPEPQAGAGGAAAGDIAVDLDSAWLEEAAERTDIPPRVLRAYIGASVWSAQRHEECSLPWNTLAGIGSVESDHGRYGDAEVGEDGQLEGKIIGAQLNGLETARIADTDDGKYDGDAEFDRAVGPMQFIPSTWEDFAVDGNGDGEADPNHIDDASATAASYLCSGKRDLSDEGQWVEAILAYNPSDEYVALVAERATAVAESMAEMEDGESAGPDVAEDDDAADDDAESGDRDGSAP
ncbi:lytic transglycosylase domain-containing protein [Brevibacterium album]|uniref:lytic transglycosylase domain-containing protein n=1 Tax=Brevibacterium album TaxID=417948 RepID=UPI00041E42D8|nr:lytic transglycosylase domain-containing protein [Brevibacterium album]